VFLKRSFDSIILKLIFLLFFISLPANSNEKNLLQDALTYLKNFDEFSSSFLQMQNNDISEGSIFIKGKRIRIEYITPSNLIFVLKENKGMYFNAELNEVQYFNPKNTIGIFLVDLFNNDNFLKNSLTIKRKGYFYIQKEVLLEDITYKIKIFFEEKPLQLKKLEIINGLDIISFTILNPNYNPNLNKKIFSLANPLL